MPNFALDDLIEIRIVSSGDDCAMYDFDVHTRGLRLTALHQTPKPAPFDLAEVPDTSLDNADNVPVWLVTPRSIFPGAVAVVRPIGVLNSQDGAAQLRWIVAVPAVDSIFDTTVTIGDLPDERRQALITQARNGGGEVEIRYEAAAAALDWIHQAKQQTRLDRARQEKKASLQPAWKPLGYLVAGARRTNETEPNSDAEYAYHQLPLRFQKYVDEYLAPNERILFAVNRPAMKSGLKRSWLSHATLQEGILFVTDQQVSLVTEILPPGTSNIRYGYIAQLAPPERVQSIEVKPIEAQAASFEVTWFSACGPQTLTWEFPPGAIDELREVARILSAWQPHPNDQRLRRATPIEPLKIPLHDPAANDPNETLPVVRRLEEAIAHEVKSNETILAWALLPAWVERRGYAEAVVATTRRLLRLPDPAANRLTRVMDVHAITSLEFSLSILESYLTVHFFDQGRLRIERIPYPFAAQGFKECLLALRRQMVIL